MPVPSVQDLFLYELCSMYDAEHRIVQMLPQLANECNDSQIKDAFQRHEEETRHQIQNLESCFQVLGYEPQRVTCHVVQGLKEDHDSLTKENPPEDVLTMFNVGGAAQTEYFEMACYRGLVEKADRMGLGECSRLLQENLRQEEDMARKCEQIGRDLGQRIPSTWRKAA